MKINIYIIIVWNIIVALIYGLDKLLSQGNKRRISENVLLTISLLMGAMGGMFGMILFNHKTRKMKFRLTIPIFVLLNIAIYYLLKI